MYLYSHIKGVRETEEGTEIIILLPEKIKSHILKQHITKAEVRLDDGRTISNEQRKRIYATINDIISYSGDRFEYTKEYFKEQFMMATGEEYFSLSDCSMTLAKDFLTYLMYFSMYWGLPLTEYSLRAEDSDKYLYGCLKYRTCAITGKPFADIHHVVGSTVGMGSNRKKISHTGKKLIALSREYHNLVHQEGEQELFEKYKVYGVELDSETLRELGIRSDDID